MSFVTAALIGAGGALVGGYLSSQGASSAASAQSAAANQANQTQWQMYNQQRQDQTPWRNAGNSALGQLSYMMGLPGYGGQMGSMSMGGGYNPNGGSYGIEGRTPRPQTGGEGGSYQMIQTDPNNPESATLQWVDGQQGTDQGGLMSGYSGQLSSSQFDGTQYNPSMGSYGSLMTPFSQTSWQTDPGYQFRLSEGTKALERSAAAKGMSLSGAQQKALAGYNQNFASNEYGNVYNRYNTDQNTQYNRLASMAGIGQTANNALGQAGTNYANNVSNNQMQLGAGQSAAALAGGNAWQGAINSGVNSWNNYNMWNAMQNKGG